MAERILIVDDEEGIRELLLTYLGDFGFEVAAVSDGSEMRRHLAEHPVDLVLLDLGLPHEDGLVLARELRSRNDVPGIVIITGRGEPVDRILGLELGADDYIAKPFDLREVVARVRSVLRRLRPPEGAAAASTTAPASSAGPAAERFEFDGWRVDLGARSVLRPDGTAVSLTTSEFDLLATLVRHPNRALTRDELMDALYRREAGPFDRAVDVLVGRLRRKIEHDPAEPQLVKSVRGIGYLFAARVSPASGADRGPR